MQNKSCQNRLKQQGLTLLEVLVAFVIVGLVLGVSFQAVSASLNAQTNASDYELAGIHMQSLLANLGGDISLTNTESSGNLTHDFSYKVIIKDYQDPDANFNELTKDSLLLVEIQILKASNDFEYSVLTLRPNPEHEISQ